MFTGIIEQTGKLVRIGNSSLEVECGLGPLRVGESISVNGACLTVSSVTEGTLVADLSEETLERTNLGALQEGDAVNLERPLAAGDPLGGHIVQGHVDGVGRVVEARRLAGSVQMTIEVPETLSRYLVEKGSVAVDGVSLTVTLASGNRFSVALVPYTLEATNLGSRRPGDAVNIEADILAKYVERLAAKEDQ